MLFATYRFVRYLYGQSRDAPASKAGLYPQLAFPGVESSTVGGVVFCSAGLGGELFAAGTGDSAADDAAWCRC